MAFPTMFGLYGLGTMDAPVAPAQRLNELIDITLNFKDAKAAAETALSVQADEIVFDKPIAIAAGVSEIDAESLSMYVGETNSLITQGKLALGASWQDITSLSASLWEGEIVNKTINGRSYVLSISLGWFGYTIHMSKALTEKVTAALNIGAGAAALTAVILAWSGAGAPAVPIAGIVSALLWIGVDIYKTYICVGGFIPTPA